MMKSILRFEVLQLQFRFFLLPVLLLIFSCGEDKLELGIEGKVLGESGQPIPAAIVKIDGPESQSVVTDTDGRFFVGDILAGTYQISVSKAGYKIYSGNVRVLEKIATADVVLEKEDSQTVSGVVRDQQTNQLMPNVQLTTNPVTYSVTSDDEGAYKFGQKMKPATYTIMAKAEGYEPAAITVEVVLGEPTRADISMGVKPVLYVQPDVIQFGNTATSKVLTIQNRGTGQLIWSIGVPTEDWLQVTPLKGITREVGSSINITVNREGLKPNPPPATL
ncbi:TPA: carboxypeptidase regulatory-like domain-containing protein, partial [Candidatus Poribacteria bacterium]|nr:carboxypeptidase regulatory-like domain-containing protein [Candidatus Poribacteria bacterium]